MNHDEKLHVVYEGETPDDYPGGNENFLIGGWDYDRRETQWREVDKKDWLSYNKQVIKQT